MGPGAGATHSTLGFASLRASLASGASAAPVDPAAAGAELEAELLAYCRAELATYKCPRTIDFVAELPRDPNGKLYKRLLRERYWKGHDSRVI